jgi:hypothetical protein
LEYFLKYESDGASVRWEVNDCGEQSGDPRVDKGREFPVCVQAESDLKHQRTLTVVIVTGSAKDSLASPAVWSITVTYVTGEVRSLRRLGDLPMELHRRLPRMPKDVPGTAGLGGTV